MASFSILLVVVNAREWFICTSQCSNHMVTCRVLTVTSIADGFSKSRDLHCMHSENKISENRLMDGLCCL